MRPPDSEPFFTCESLCVCYDSVEILHGVSLSIQPGELVGIIGPNGSGKSTLLRALSGTLRPSGGKALLHGQPVGRMRARERAHLIGVVQQKAGATFAFTVWDIVAMGRHAHLAALQGLRPEDRAAVDWALERTDCTRFADRPVTELSGGELQRVIIARALAQEPQALLLDEPTNHLDINHQLEIARLLQTLNQERAMTIVWVSHDVNLAAEFCERVIMLADGKLVADGDAGQVITGPRLSALYGVNVPVLTNPLTGKPQVVMVAEEACS